MIYLKRKDQPDLVYKVEDGTDLNEYSDYAVLDDSDIMAEHKKFVERAAEFGVDPLESPVAGYVYDWSKYDLDANGGVLKLDDRHNIVYDRDDDKGPVGRKGSKK